MPEKRVLLEYYAVKLLFILVEKFFHLTFLGFLDGVDKGCIARKANKTNSHFVWSRCHVAINKEVELPAIWTIIGLYTHILLSVAR